MLLSPCFFHLVSTLIDPNPSLRGEVASTRHLDRLGHQRQVLAADQHVRLATAGVFDERSTMININIL